MLEMSSSRGQTLHGSGSGLMGLGTCEAGRASEAMGMSVIFTMLVLWAECRLRLYLKGICSTRLFLLCAVCAVRVS